MTFSPFTTPTDPRELYAHMGAKSLAAHIRAALRQLAALGVVIAPAVGVIVEEIDEAVLEHESRTDSLAIPRALAAAEADLAAAAIVGVAR